MTFTSIEFAVLLVLVLVIYWLVPRVAQNLTLLGASYLFYAYVDPLLSLLLAGYTLVTYFAARRIETDREHAKRYVFLSVAAMLGALGVFKYAGFFVDSVGDVLGLLGLARFDSTLNIILPIGISFYTFQSLGYVIDVYKGRTHARRNVVDTALFVSFFPQLVAGPIERATNLLPQFESRRNFEPSRVSSGIALLSWGFFKKLVIADNFGLLVDSIFSSSEPGAALLWVGTFAFGVQILADFSGYTDIARGTARILGIDLSVNFRHPWLAKSPTDFWRRWHITLSAWLRDYVYIPLGGNQHGKRRTSLNVIATFVLGGLWHGAAWNFVLWGLVHAGLVLVNRAISGFRFNIPAIIPVIVTFFLVSATWLLFRESDLDYISKNAFSVSSDLRFAIAILFSTLIYSLPVWLHAIVERPTLTNIWTRNDVRRSTAYALVTLTSFVAILILRAPTSSEFIYFRF